MYSGVGRSWCERESTRTGVLARACAATCLVFLLCGSAKAQSVEEALVEAETTLEGQEFAEAHEQILAVIEMGHLSPRQLARAHRALAECAAALRRPDDAEEAFVTLLAIEPDFTLPEMASPLLTAPFEAAQDFWIERQRPEILFSPPDSGEGPIVLAPEVLSGDLPSLIVSLTVHLRLPNGRYGTVTVEPGGYEVPRSALDGAEQIEFFIAARDVHGNVVMSSGTPQSPLTLVVGSTPAPPPPTDDRRWYQRWWVWTLLGVAVVGVAVSVPLALFADNWSDPCHAMIGRSCDEQVVVEPSQ